MSTTNPRVDVGLECDGTCLEVLLYLGNRPDGLLLRASTSDQDIVPDVELGVVECFDEKSGSGREFVRIAFFILEEVDILILFLSILILEGRDLHDRSFCY